MKGSDRRDRSSGNWHRRPARTGRLTHNRRERFTDVELAGTFDVAYECGQLAGSRQARQILDMVRDLIDEHLAAGEATDTPVTGFAARQWTVFRPNRGEAPTS